jgi:hypothetical protein
MKIFFFLLFLVSVSACMIQRPVSSEKPHNNSDYTVKYLFEYGGCKVYRFLDQGNLVYFTNCNGQAINKTDSTVISNTTRVIKN